MNKYKIENFFRNIFNEIFEDRESINLNNELNQIIMEIRKENYKFIVIEKLIPYYQEVFHLNENEAWGASHALYLKGVECGKIDCLNSLNYEWKGNKND